MSLRGMPIVLGFLCLIGGAGALRAKEQGRSSPASGFTGFASEALQQANQPPDFGKMLQGMADWMKKQGEAAAAKPTDTAAPKNPLNDLLNIMKPKEQQAVPAGAKPAETAAPQNPLGGLLDILKQKQQQAAPAAAQPAETAAPKNPLGGLLDILKQKQQQQAAAPAQTTAAPAAAEPAAQAAPAAAKPAETVAPKNPLGGLLDILKQKQQQAAAPAQTTAAPASNAAEPVAQAAAPVQTTAAPAANAAEPAAQAAAPAQASAAAAANAAEPAAQAAGQGARKSLDDLLKWVKSQGEKAAKDAGEQAARAAQEKAAKAGEGKAAEAKPASDKTVSEVAKSAQDAWKQLIDKAKKSAKETAEEAFPKVMETTTTEAKAVAQSVSKAAVDSSIAEAEAQVRAAGAQQADSAAKQAAERAAHAASQKALEDLLAWAEGSAGQDVEADDEKPKKAGSPVRDAWASAADATKKAGSPVRDAWVSAADAAKKAKMSDWLAKSAEEMAHAANALVAAGHNKTQAIQKLGLPGAANAALKTIKDVVSKANHTIRKSSMAGKLAAYARAMVRKSVEAARRTSNKQDFTKAWAAVRRAYNASGRADEDARRALLHSREAMQAVVFAVGEAGWRAVQEVLQSEMQLFYRVAQEAAKKSESDKFFAWLEGVAQAKNVAGVAWLKGFSQGLQTASARDAVGKVKAASGSTAKAAIAWTQGVTKVMSSKEARDAVAKAAGSATRAAAAAAASAMGTASHTLFNALRKPVQAPKHTAGKQGTKGQATKGRFPWIRPGSSITASGGFSVKGGYTGTVSGTYGGAGFGGHIHFKPNSTHARLFAKGKIATRTREAHGKTLAAVANDKTKSTAIGAFFETSGKDGLPSGGLAGKVRAVPVKAAQHLKAEGQAWAGERRLRGGLDALATEDGRAMGKVTGTLVIPELKEPLKVNADFVQPTPTRTR